VALQALLLLPALRGAGVGRLRWRWDPGHEAVHTILRLGAWTFGFVVANQVALYVVLALAVGAPGGDPVSAYTYAYTFMQMPYAVVAVSVMSAVTPDLAERWATGDEEGFRRRLAVGLRATLAIIVPAAVGMLVLAKPAVALLLAHGSTSVAGSSLTGSTLALLAIGLPGFCTYLYEVRVLQAMQRTKAAFWLYLVENGLNVVFALALVHAMGVRGLALSLSIAYTIGAIVGLGVLRRWLGTLGGRRMWAPLRRVVAASAVMGVVVLIVSNLSGSTSTVGLLVRVVVSVLAGGAVYLGVGLFLGGRRRPIALLTGAPGDVTPTAPRVGELRRVGGLGGSGWGDSSVPVNTGPRIRILTPPPEAGTGAVPISVARAGSRPPPARRPEGARPRAAPAPHPPPAAHSAPAEDPEDNGDDPGERRWLGGTTATRPRRGPR
jgi:peptidoglycan biosynthesis protein MviN/MurJ (putative lipid II flippase)